MSGVVPSRDDENRQAINAGERSFTWTWVRAWNIEREEVSHSKTAAFDNERVRVVRIQREVENELNVKIVGFIFRETDSRLRVLRLNVLIDKSDGIRSFRRFVWIRRSVIIRTKMNGHGHRHIRKTILILGIARAVLCFRGPREHQGCHENC